MQKRLLPMLWDYTTNIYELTNAANSCLCDAKNPEIEDIREVINLVWCELERGNCSHACVCNINVGLQEIFEIVHSSGTTAWTKLISPVSWLNRWQQSCFYCPSIICKLHFCHQWLITNQYLPIDDCNLLNQKLTISLQFEVATKPLGRNGGKELESKPHNVENGLSRIKSFKSQLVASAEPSIHGRTYTGRSVLQ